MKFYHIFKPHIVEFGNGTFAVRKRGWLGFAWVYKDSKGWSYSSWSEIQWWTEPNLNHSKVRTFDEAIEVMKMTKFKPNVILKVYHG
jgi:hypothetical protein